MTKPFFILPDAEAGDARNEVIISIEGGTYLMTAGMVVELIRAAEVARDQLSLWSKPEIDNRMERQQHDQVTRYLRDVLEPFGKTRQ